MGARTEQLVQRRAMHFAILSYLFDKEFITVNIFRCYQIRLLKTVCATIYMFKK